MNKINDLKAMFKSFDGKESRAEYKELEKAERLYLKAVESAGYKYSNRKIIRTKRDEVDAEGEMQYNRKTPYIQWKSDALAWANDSKRNVGDIDSGADNNYYYFYEAIDPYGDNKATDYRVIAKVNADNEDLLSEWFKEVELSNERDNASVYERLDKYESARKEYQGNDTITLGQHTRNGQSDSLYQRESEGNGERDTQRSGENKQGIKFSLKDSNDIKFSKKRVTYISYSKIGNDNVDFIRKQLENLYYEIDSGIANGLAIEKNNMIYIIDSGNDNGDITFGARETFKIEDKKLRNRVLEDINERAISKGYISDELFEKVRCSPGNDRSGGVGRELSKELSTDKGQSQNNEKRVPNSNANRGIRGLTKEKSQFSLKIGNEQLNINGEVTDKLVALHNLSEDSLIKVIELGGFPMPSIAITKPTIPHNDFGDITVVFGRDSISPTDRRNKVYSRDAWTPAFPRVDVLLNKSKVDTIQKQFNDLVGENKEYKSKIRSFFENYWSYSGEYEVEGSDYSKESIVNRARNNLGITAAYLKENGIDITPIFREKRYMSNGNETRLLSQKEVLEIADKVGINKDNLHLFNVKRNGDEGYSDMVEAIREAYRKHYAKDNKYTDKILDSFVDDIGFQEVCILCDSLYKIYENIEASEIDTYATESNLRSAVKNQEDFADWIWSKVSSTEETKGIRNDKDPFLSSGNRRKFAGRHDSYDLENIVKNMLKETQVGKGTVFGQSMHSIAARLSTEFDSIASVKEAKHLLQATQDEDFDEVSSASREALDEILDDIGAGGWNRIDDITQMVADCALVRPITPAKIYNSWQKQIQGYEGLKYKFTMETATKVHDFFYMIKDIPTRYFEAKPKRVVGLSEIKQVLVPDSTSKDFLDTIEKAGISYTIYNKDEENARSELLQSMENVQFSRKDNLGNALSQEQIDFFNDSKVRDKDGNLQVVYHGSGFDFNVFDKKRIGRNYSNWSSWGKGFYFSSSKKNATFWAGKSRGDSYVVKAYYLDIKKPFILNEAVDSDLLSELDKYGISELEKRIASHFGSSFVNMFNGFNGDLTETLTKHGYDGIIANYIDGGDYMVFESNQIKLTSNKNPTESVDIRYSKKEGKTYYKLTEGQLKKIIANNTKYKTYTLADSEAIINNVLSQYMSFGDKYGELSGKTKNQVIDMLWNGLNSADSGYQMNVALNIADYIIQNGVLENIYGDADFAWAVDIIYILKPYLHSLDLSGISEEIKHRYDTDKSPYLLWGKRRGSSGIAPDQLGQLLEETGLQIDAINEADIFIQVDDLYRSAVKALKKKAKSFLSEGLSSEEQKNLKQEIAREVLRGYDYTGGDSKLAGIVNKYTDRIRVLKEQLQDEKVRNSVINRLLDKTQKLKDLKLGTFLNATEFKSDIFKGSIEKLAAIKFRGDLNQSGTRDIVKGLAEWYVETNEIVGEAYENEIGEALNEIANGKGKLITQELCNLTNIVDYFKHFVETYNKVLRNGQYVEAQPIAEGYIQTLRDNKAIKVGWFNKVSGSSYVKIFGDPMSVATESRNTWNDGDKYFKKLISDIHGIPTLKGAGNRAMAFVRGNYAKYQLGFNPKV